MNHIGDIGLQLCLYALLPYGVAWFYNQIRGMLCASSIKPPKAEPEL